MSVKHFQSELSNMQSYTAKKQNKKKNKVTSENILNIKQVG